MRPSRPSSWVPLAGIFLLMAGGLVWLMFGFTNDRGGWRGLPDVTEGENGSTIEYLLDDGGLRSFAEITHVKSGAWRRQSSVTWTPIEVGQALWLRVTLRNPAGHAAHGVLVSSDCFEDEVDAWIADAGEWRHERSGEKIAAKDKPVWGREAAFPVEVPARGERVVYLRATDYFDTVVLAEWWPDANGFHAAQLRRLLVNGIYFGGLLALLGYNLLLWLRLRAADIGYYVGYLGAMTTFMLLARAQFSVLGWPLSSPVVETAITMAAAMAGIFTLQFARVFLELKSRAPRANRMARGMSLLLAVLVLGALTIPWTDYSLWMGPTAVAVAATHAGLLAIAIWLWSAGMRQARFFVLSTGCLFSGCLPLVAIWFHFQSDALRNGGMMGLMVGSALEMLMLSLAIADRFAQAQREKNAAQAQLVEEAEQRRAIQEAYADELEVEVRERTRELELANADKDRMLAVLGHDLRSPLTGLTQSAEQQAALTEGAPGFAADAARTGRALLLLIEDLVLWARLRAGQRQLATHPARAVVAPAAALHRALAHRGGVELSVQVPVALEVRTDLVLAQALLRNLLANALKFARSRVALCVAEDERGGARFTVIDDGAGLPAAVAARLAANEDEPVTVDSGLGLRLCREISGALGTRLEARTAAGGGAEFGFTLPLAKIEVTA